MKRLRGRADVGAPGRGAGTALAAAVLAVPVMAVLVPTAAVAMPAVGNHAGSTSSVGRPGPLVSVRGREGDWTGRLRGAVWLSPNGDRSRDKGVVRFALAKRSMVSVRVVAAGSRAGGAGRVVVRAKLGALARGDRTWTWNGRDSRGRVVDDGVYRAVLVARQVGGHRTGRAQASVFVDTRFNARWRPESTDDSVYPQTLVVRDLVGITLNNAVDRPRAMLGKVREQVIGPDGKPIQARRFDYHTASYTHAMPLSFSGRRTKGFDVPLPAGRYRLRYTVWDMAGNRGGTRTLPIAVSAARLVEASGSTVVPPVGPTLVPAARAAHLAARGGDDTMPVPCGAVVPSEVYGEPGAMSYRSSDTCGGDYFNPSIATAVGTVDLEAVLTPEVAPRGLRTSWVSMRGRPTVPDETDTAEIYTWYPSTTATSVPTPSESVTTTGVRGHAFEPPYFDGYDTLVDWTITTRGQDSYDVAAVTVHYTYLTPQG